MRIYEDDDDDGDEHVDRYRHSLDMQRPYEVP